MRRIVLRSETDWDGWRQATRALVQAGAEPGTLTWAVGGDVSPLPDAAGTFQVPRVLMALASVAIQAREPERFGLLYSLVWRIGAGEKVLEDDTDPDLALVRRMALAVRADAHRMRTGLRYLPVAEGGGVRYLGWFEPAHFVLPANARLLARRYPELRLSIVTPDGSAHWDGASLLFGDGLRHAADDEALQAWWDTHRDLVLDHASADVSVPEAEAMDEAPRSPDRPAIGPVVLNEGADPDLRRAAREAGSCRRCPLHGPATQTVFGEGPAGARAMFVGEQPGDQEDMIGRPFVGPAGQLMDRAMEEAGIDRRMVYVTNAVKHFKFEARGRRRIHQTPEVPEIQACGFWLDVERTRIRPILTVAMGASAARAVLGRAVTIGRERGRPIRMADGRTVTIGRERGRPIRMADGRTVFVTVHPSYILRLPDRAAKDREYAALVGDLRLVRDLVDAG